MSLLIPGTNSIKDTGYEVTNSLRVDTAANDHLSRSISSAGSGQIWTASAWFKRSVLGQSASIYCSSKSDTTANFRSLFIEGADRVQCAFYDGGYTFQVETSALLRDQSAWYHIVTAVDTTQSTDTNRVKIYINGTLQTSFSTANYPSHNSTLNFSGTDIKQLVSSLRDGSSIHNSGYIAELHILDGVAKQASDFGEYDEDSPTIWKPKEYDGSYGTNGFYMEFKESGTSANSSGIGADTSGNNNHFSVHNITALNQSTDTCTNNFATMNPLDNYYYSTAFSQGNLKLTFNASNYGWNTSTFGLSQGKWYLEIKIVSGSSHTTGIVDRSPTASQQDLSAQSFSSQYGVNGTAYVNGSSSASYSTFTNGDIIGIALDLDNNKLYYSKNGTFQGSSDPSAGSGGLSITDPTSVPNGFYFIAVGDSGTSGNPVSEVNFGSPTFSISSGNSDANGYGNFEYSVPTGFYTINTKNLAEFG
jgi:hypothetical protein